MALLLVGLLPAAASAMEIEPGISVGEVYTSNVNLAPDGLEEDEWITRVVPSLRLGYNGGRLDFELDYALEALFYASDSDRNEVFNQLNADALLDLIGEELQFRARGTMTQVNVSPEEAVASDNINVTGNRSDANSFDLGPEWNTPVFGDAVFDGHLLVGRVTYDDTPRDDDATDPVQDLVQDIKTVDGEASLRSSDTAASPVTWELAYEYDRLDYELSGVAEQQSAWLRTGYRFSPQFELFALGGLDSDYADLDDSSLSEGRWEAGFDLGAPTAHLEAAVGERYWGTTWRVMLESLREESTYRLSYDESPTTTDRTQIRQIPIGVPGDPGVDPVPPPPESGIDRYGNPSRFLQRRADALASWRLSRTTTTLEAFWDRREDQIELDPASPDGTPRADETSYGVIGTVGIEVGAHSRLGFSASWRQREYVTTEDPALGTDEDQVVDGMLSFDHDLGLLTTLNFRTGLQKRTGTAGGEGDYDEYWASAALTRRF